MKHFLPLKYQVLITLNLVWKDLYNHLILKQKTADRYESSHERRNMIPKWRGKFGPQMAKSTFSAFLSLIPTHVKVFRNTELQVRLSYLVLFTYFTMMNYQAIWTYKDIYLHVILPFINTVESTWWKCIDLRYCNILALYEHHKQNNRAVNYNVVFKIYLFHCLFTGNHTDTWEGAKLFNNTG